MIETAISHYSAPWNPAPERNPRKRDKILEKLGVGGMGVVCNAENTPIKRIVAPKFLSPDLTRDEEAKERFIHEAQAASALDHPNICNVREISRTDDGQLFIAMAYYKGESLRRTHRANRHTCASKGLSRYALE